MKKMGIADFLKKGACNDCVDFMLYDLNPDNDMEIPAFLHKGGNQTECANDTAFILLTSAEYYLSMQKYRDTVKNINAVEA